MPTLTLKGNNTGGTANPLDLTVAQVNAILPVFTSALNGLTPLSGGGTANFLRADGTWTTINLSSNVSNILPVANGGTGDNSLTAHAVLIGEGTSAIAQVVASTSGQVLISNGSSSDPSFTATPLLGVVGSAAGSISFANTTNTNIVVVSASGPTASYNFNLPATTGTLGQVLTSSGGSAIMTWTTPSVGTVTSFSESGPSGVLSGSVATATTTPALTLSWTGTSGGITYFSSSTTMASSALLAANQPVLGGGAGTAPYTLTNGTAGQVLTSAGTTLAPTWTTPTAAPTLTSLGIRSGQTTLASSITTKAVTFSSTLGTTSYAVTATMANTTDTNPQFQPITITAQSATGFTASWNVNTATANYVLNWTAIVNN
jgi:hypothetical protein